MQILEWLWTLDNNEHGEGFAEWTNLHTTLQNEHFSDSEHNRTDNTFHVHRGYIKHFAA